MSLEKVASHWLLNQTCTHVTSVTNKTENNWNRFLIILAVIVWMSNQLFKTYV